MTVPGGRAARSSAAFLGRSLVAPLGPFLARHWAFLLLLAAGVAMRVVVTLAYRPVLFYVDSLRYLSMLVVPDPAQNSPLGYSYLVLWPVLAAVPSLLAVPVVQHLLGLGIAVAAYAFLLRRRAWPWLAALATAPVLLDGYQLQIEQLLMSDTVFVALLFVALLLLGRRAPGPLAATLAGLVLAAAGLTRIVGLVCGVVAVAYVLLAGGPRLRRVASAACLGAALVAPLVVYASYYASWHGEYRLTPANATAAYARVAPFADCRRFEVPEYEKVLCQYNPPEERPGPEFYHWSKNRPASQLRPPAGVGYNEALRDFTRRVILHQPVEYAAAVTHDLLRGFAWAKTTEPGEPAVERWQFPAGEPVHTYAVTPWTDRYGGGAPRTDVRLAHFLAGYQQHVFLRGTLVGLCGLLALLGALGAGRARRSGMRALCGLALGLPGITLALAATVEFSWRYQLPAIVLFPVAGALGLTAMVRRSQHQEPIPVTGGVDAAVGGTTGDHGGRTEERAVTPVARGHGDQHEADQADDRNENEERVP